ncbi:AbrB/MazE/SpoVT family DNA-binding domain-containing protein [Hyperthermus butylicus]|uniref:SpoVT-AbrB domain-containing protein n=1 Tax=Hyperthermus butylicus (strain DSM 5456 / JCM 9403 / PLM1-5) TaxID=415426 RepID=A2BKL8_HYPBU|nr:AbrB/MazE/SpoVT family DNA-binding domain-containing protein [Hyperthermus butylicus]ABM80529.1 hypothetical protein Hbut_0673 [Hyperthermus butylicus DSM 5456]
MAVRVKVDERGRITLPKEIRVALNIMPGDELSVNVVGNKIIIEKSMNPFEKLSRLLGNISFDRHLRIEAEREALRSTRERLDKRAKEMPPRNGLSTGAQP